MSVSFICTTKLPSIYAIVCAHRHYVTVLFLLVFFLSLFCLWIAQRRLFFHQIWKLIAAQHTHTHNTQRERHNHTHELRPLFILFYCLRWFSWTKFTPDNISHLLHIWWHYLRSFKHWAIECARQPTKQPTKQLPAKQSVSLAFCKCVCLYRIGTFLSALPFFAFRWGQIHVE